MTKKRKSVLLECLDCGTKWRVGFNRINKKKITSCPKCNKKPNASQEIMAILQRDNLKAKFLCKK